MRYLLLLTLLTAPSLRAQNASPPQRWEYAQLVVYTGGFSGIISATLAAGDSVQRVIEPTSSGRPGSLFTLLPPLLNSLGDKGWELVAVNTAQDGWIYLFKRRKG